MSIRLYENGSVAATAYAAPNHTARVRIDAGLKHITLAPEDALSIGRVLHEWASLELRTGAPTPIDGARLRDAQQAVLELTRETVNIADYLAGDPSISGIARSTHTLRERAERARRAIAVFLRGVE